MSHAGIDRPPGGPTALHASIVRPPGGRTAATAGPIGHRVAGRRSTPASIRRRVAPASRRGSDHRRQTGDTRRVGLAPPSGRRPEPSRHHCTPELEVVEPPRPPGTRSPLLGANRQPALVDLPLLLPELDGLHSPPPGPRIPSVHQLLPTRCRDPLALVRLEPDAQTFNSDEPPTGGETIEERKRRNAATEQYLRPCASPDGPGEPCLDARLRPPLALYGRAWRR